MSPPRALVTVLAGGALASGCLQLTDDGGPWEATTTVTGALSIEHGPPPTARALATGCTLRVATWNVHFGEDPDDLAGQLAASTEIARADVLLVQEIEAYGAEPGTRSARLARALGMTWVYAPARVEGDGTHGIATLSRLPLDATLVRRLPFFDQPLNPRDRIALATDVVLGDARVQIVNLHLDVRLGPVDRIRQLHPAVNDIAERVIVGGDFNTNPWAWVDGILPLAATEAIVDQEQAAVVDDYLTGKAFTGAVPVSETTMRLPAFQIRTDDLYARGLPVIAAGVEHVDGSDHWPVWFDVDVCATP